MYVFLCFLKISTPLSGVAGTFKTRLKVHVENKVGAIFEQRSMRPKGGACTRLTLSFYYLITITVTITITITTTIVVIVVIVLVIVVIAAIVVIVVSPKQYGFISGKLQRLGY